MKYEPPHEARDTRKLRHMIETLEAGGELPPVVVWQYSALTGSHRLAAWDACDMPAQVVEVSNEEAIAAMASIRLEPGVDDIRDYGQFCEALYKVTKDPQIKAALEDQRD